MDGSYFIFLESWRNKNKRIQAKIGKIQEIIIVYQLFFFKTSIVITVNHFQITQYHFLFPNQQTTAAS